MTAKQLTDSILLLAIQGKLVSQDPNEEPASVLLERIKEEKKRLVNEGLLKKKDLEELPVGEDEEPFIIPEGWRWARLGTLCTVKGGKRIPVGKSFSDVPTRHVYIRVTDMKNHSLSSKNLKYISDSLYEILKQYTISKDDLYLTIAGTIGDVGVVPDEFDGMNLTENAVKLSYLQANKYFLLYSILSPFIQAQFVDKTKQMAQPKLAIERIKTTMIPLPPLAEQLRIVERIEEILPLVKEYGEAYEEASKMDAELPDKLKKSILQEAIMGKLGTQDPNDEPASDLLEHIREEKKRLVKEGVLKKKDLEETPVTEDEEPFKIPESWEWVRVSDIVSILMGQSPDGNDVYEAENEDNAYEFHQGKICFTEKYIAPSGKWCKAPARIASANSLLVCVRAPIGDVNVTQRTIGIGRGLSAIKGFSNINVDFLYYWMKAHKRCLVEQGTGSTFKAITVDVLRNQPIPLPPLAEQHRIVEKIEALFDEIDNMTINKSINQTDIEETEE